MYLKFIVAAGVSIVLLLTIHYWLSKTQANKNRPQQGIALVMLIQRIISHCQHHREISNTVSNGDNKFKTQLISIQSELDNLIKQVVEIGLDKFAQWATFVEHWPRLRQHSLQADLPSRNLLRQHNVMVDGHVSLLDEQISLDVAAFFKMAIKPMQELVNFYNNLITYGVRNTS